MAKLNVGCVLAMASGACAIATPTRRRSALSSSTPAASSTTSRSNADRPNSLVSASSAGSKSSAHSGGGGSALADVSRNCLRGARAAQRTARPAIAGCGWPNRAPAALAVCRACSWRHAQGLRGIEGGRIAAEIEQEAVDAVDAQPRRIGPGGKVAGKSNTSGSVAALRGLAVASAVPRTRLARCRGCTCGRENRVAVTRSGAVLRSTVAAGSESPASAAMTSAGAMTSATALVSRSLASPVGSRRSVRLHCPGASAPARRHRSAASR